ncbi:MAG: hypothetical protein ACI82A_002865 [Candidatus Azotimanducaceae bacterium]|jgi:hypothetical protein
MVRFEDMIRVAEIYLVSSKSEDVLRLARDIAIYFCRRCVTNFWRAEESAKPELCVEGNTWMAAAFPDWLDVLISDMELTVHT